MKKIINVMVVGLLLFSATACEDFFETNSPSAMDESVFKSTVLTEQAIGAIYNTFGEDKSFRNRLCGGYVGMNTDIEYCNKGSGQALEAATYSLTSGTGDLSTADGKDPWGYLNAAVERANVVIDGIQTYSDTTDATFRYLLGEALTLRAFCYLELVKLWGDVPATFTSFDGMDINELYVDKTDRNVIYEQLRKDLKRAAELMPWSEACPGMAANNTGRPSKALAYALLARMDLMYAGKALRPDPSSFTSRTGTDGSVRYNVEDAEKRRELYQEVVWACAEIIKKEDGKLQPSFEKVFRDLCGDVTQYSASEFIWALPFLDGARGQVLCLNGLKMDATCAGKMINTEDGDTKTIQTKVQGMVRIVPTFIFDFEKGDPRRDVTVCPFSWKYDNGSSVNSSYTDKVFPYDEASAEKMYQKLESASSMYLGKFRVEWMKRKYNVNEDGIDMPVIRYADVLLMFAEASIGSMEGNRPQELYGLDPEEQFNKVRGRVGLDDLPLTMENIIKERAFELCGENVRKYDLMRWGLLKTQLETTQSRIEDLSAGRNEFSGRMDSIYIHYALAEGLTQTADHAYVLDSVYGLRLGDTPPPSYSKENGWVKKSFYTNKDTEVLASYRLYKEGVDIDKRHYWPIFQTNINASNGTLWNDYGY